MRRLTRPHEHVQPGNLVTPLPSVARAARKKSVTEQIGMSKGGLLFAVT